MQLFHYLLQEHHWGRDDLMKIPEMSDEEKALYLASAMVYSEDNEAAMKKAKRK